MPIKVNNVVQTGANNQFGGLKLGLFTETYQVSMEEAVAMPPTEPSATQNKILPPCQKYQSPIDSIDLDFLNLPLHRKHKQVCALHICGVVLIFQHPLTLNLF